MKLYLRVSEAREELTNLKFSLQSTITQSEATNFTSITANAIGLVHQLELKQVISSYKSQVPQFTVWPELVNESEIKLTELTQEISKDLPTIKSDIINSLYDCVTNLLRIALSALVLADSIDDQLYPYTEQRLQEDSDSDNENLEQNFEISEAQTSYLIRRDVVTSQLLTSVIFGILNKVLSEYLNGEFWEMVEKYGLLLNFETLVSNWRNERVMMEDQAACLYAEIASSKVKFIDYREVVQLLILIFSVH